MTHPTQKGRGLSGAPPPASVPPPSSVGGRWGSRKELTSSFWNKGCPSFQEQCSVVARSGGSQVWDAEVPGSLESSGRVQRRSPRSACPKPAHRGCGRPAVCRG